MTRSTAVATPPPDPADVHRGRPKIRFWSLNGWFTDSPHERTVEPVPELPTSGPTSARVAQATGIVSVQAHCAVEAAFDLLRERAFMLGQTLDVIALDVIDHVIRFEP